MTYYVATLSTWVLIEAQDETEAKAKGEIELSKLFAERGRPAQINVRTVRPANDDELQMALWQKELEGREKG